MEKLGNGNREWTRINANKNRRIGMLLIALIRNQSNNQRSFAGNPKASVHSQIINLDSTGQLNGNGKSRTDPER